MDEELKSSSGRLLYPDGCFNTPLANRECSVEYETAGHF